MKMLAEYLEKAISFEQMAVTETNPKVRADLEKLAASYRILAGERAKALNLSEPLPQSN
jgi:hypothetical protein